MIKWLGILLVMAVLAGCAGPTPTPDPDGPILTGFDALPKSLATVFLSPTPNAPQAQATVDSRRPTDTPVPPTFTATPTPYVGIFMGAPTFSAGGIIPTGIRGVVRVTLAPLPGTKAPPNSSAGNQSPRSCAVQAAAQFANAAKNPAVQQKLGCPRGAPFNVKLVAEPFQTGFMFWRETREIYVLSTANILKGAATDTFWRVPDNWNESIPASDPSQVAPAGLLQPVRGFGYVWRSNTTMRNSLGWAIAGEQPYDSTWQDFEHGWMMTGNNGGVFALAPLDGPPATTGIHFGVLPQ
jgi:hypothetical protein